jgi:Endonuclease/Exonuclease/phosphatase family
VADLAEVSPAVVRSTELTRWYLGTRMLVAASVLWLGFVLAQLSFSGRWWWLVFDAMPPLAFVVVPILLCVWSGIAWWRGLVVPRGARSLVSVPIVVAFLLGTGLSGLNPGALINDPSVPAGAIRVFSWNAQSSDSAAYLREQNADVYLLQEYGGVDELRLRFPEHTLVARGGLVTLSRFPVVGQEVVGSDRVLRTDINVRGRILSVYNTRVPLPFTSATSPLEPSFYRHVRTVSAERHAQLDNLVTDVTTNRGPVLVAGDFATSPSMGDLDALRDVADDAISAGTSLYPASWLAWRTDWAFTRDVDVHTYEFTDAGEQSAHRPQWLVVTLPVSG